MARLLCGLGVTDDRITVPRRGELRTVPQLLAAAYLRYCRYLDPVTGERCELEDLLDLILAQRAPVPPVNELYAVGFSLWRRRFSPRFLRRYARKVTFVDRIPDAMDFRLRGNDQGGRRNDPTLPSCLRRQASSADGVVPGSAVEAEKAMDSRLRGNDEEGRRNDKMGGGNYEAGCGNDNNAVLVWGRKFEQQAAACSLPVWRMEDGFYARWGWARIFAGRDPWSLILWACITIRARRVPLSII
ncbi:hypothetical protein MBH78_21355 [Oceanimonas sp. NS1]|nr:hypothetical protein [Oceanimonas sp. NS1]